MFSFVCSSVFFSSMSKFCSEVGRPLCKNLTPNSCFLLQTLLYICACRGIWGNTCIGSWKSFCQDAAEPNSQQVSATSDLVIQNSAHTLHRSSPFSKCLFAANSYGKGLLIPQLWAKACESAKAHLALLLLSFSVASGRLIFCSASALALLSFSFH